MEDDDNISDLSNPFHDDDDHNNRIVHTSISRKREESFWYDIQTFPDSLLIEILAKLPLKTIFMFKSVCKHWQTLISHPSFSRFYHSILNSNSNSNGAGLPFRFLYRYTYVPNLKEFVNRLAPEIHDWVLLLFTREEREQYDEQFKVLDMSNGLILCCWRSTTPFDYYICDPLTRQCITIPRRGHRFHRDFCEGLITRVNEDHMLTGYTVVRAEILDSQPNYLDLNIDMFSSETGKWINHELSCVTPIQLWKLGGGPFHCYGALHWPVSRHGYGGIDGMVAFDPYKDQKTVRLIPLPEGRNKYQDDVTFHLCGESQGTLRYFQVAHEDPTQCYSLTMTMWAMKDYEKEEWCCEFKVRRRDIHSSDLKLSNWLLDGWFEPLSFHPLNPNIVYLTCMVPECIVSYDVLNRRLDVACKHIDFYQSISSNSVIPFVLPRWPLVVVNSTIKGVK